MSSRTRAFVLSITAPVIVFALVGGFLGRVMATRRHLSAPQDLRRRRESDLEQLRRAGEHRQGDERRDERPGRFTRRRQRVSDADQVKQFESTTPPASGDLGIEFTRQYYLRVIAARENSPAAKAGLAYRRLRARDQRRADARHERLGRHAHAARRAGLEGAPHDLPRQRRRSARRRVDARSRCPPATSPDGSRRLASAMSACLRSGRARPTS